MWNWNYTNVNNEFFEEWSPELAYILGLFVSDGSISDYDNYGKKYVSFSNNTKDKDMLEKVAGVIGYKNKVLDLKSGMSRIRPSGNFVWSFFKDLGFDNNKTFNAVVPKEIIIRSELYSHFIRGLFDGDGSISIRQRRIHSYPCSSVVGTKGVVDFVANVFPFYNTCEPHVSIHRVTYDGENSVKFLNALYENSTIHMERKYEKFLKVKDWQTTCKHWTSEEKEFIKDNYESTYAKDIAKILDKSFSSVVGCARRMGLKRRFSNGKI